MAGEQTSQWISPAWHHAQAQQPSTGRDAGPAAAPGSWHVGEAVRALWVSSANPEPMLGRSKTLRSKTLPCLAAKQAQRECLGSRGGVQVRGCSLPAWHCPGLSCCVPALPRCGHPASLPPGRTWSWFYAFLSSIAACICSRLLDLQRRLWRVKA